jgi:hypothetical protein
MTLGFKTPKLCQLNQVLFKGHTPSNQSKLHPTSLICKSTWRSRLQIPTLPTNLKRSIQKLRINFTTDRRQFLITTSRETQTKVKGFSDNRTAHFPQLEEAGTTSLIIKCSRISSLEGTQSITTLTSLITSCKLTARSSSNRRVPWVAGYDLSTINLHSHRKFMKPRHRQPSKVILMNKLLLWWLINWANKYQKFENTSMNKINLFLRSTEKCLMSNIVQKLLTLTINRMEVYLLKLISNHLSFPPLYPH